MSKLGHNKTMALHIINRGRCKIFLIKNIFVKKWLFSWIVCNLKNGSINILRHLARMKNY
jgi:hypothetical protein